MTALDASPIVSCATCGVEQAQALRTCAICADERQYLPRSGQRWLSMAELAERGTRVEIVEREPGLLGLTARPGVGIGHQALLVRTEGGNLLWDPVGYLDAATVAAVQDLGGVAAIAASHPHMFGAQVQWSRAFDDAPVWVARDDAQWVALPDPAITLWRGEQEVLPGVRLMQLGGHFPGSAVAHWAAGADGRGVLLSADTISANADRTSVSFMRSFPNNLPLSAAVALRLAARVDGVPFERLYSNFGNSVETDAHAVVQLSARRHAAWVRGDFDHLT